MVLPVVAELSEIPPLPVLLTF